MSRFNFEGWNLKEFLKGREKLLVALVGAVGGWIVTQDPTLTAIVATGTEFLWAGFRYFINK